MGVYGLPWTQLGHWYRYRGTAVLFRYLTVLFRYLTVLIAVWAEIYTKYYLLRCPLDFCP